MIVPEDSDEEGIAKTIEGDFVVFDEQEESSGDSAPAEDVSVDQSFVDASAEDEESPSEHDRSNELRPRLVGIGFHIGSRLFSSDEINTFTTDIFDELKPS